MSMEKNRNYIAPSVEVIDIEIEGGFCQSSRETNYSGAIHEGWTEEEW